MLASSFDEVVEHLDDVIARARRTGSRAGYFPSERGARLLRKRLARRRSKPLSGR